MIVAVIQARMTSTRLPGKVMKRILGVPVIGLLLERLQRAKQIHKIIVAAPTDSQNDSLCDYVAQRGIEVFRGDEDDVLDRYYQAVREINPDGIVRITSDCPLLDPKVVDQVVEAYLTNKIDYVSNTHPPTFPDGLDVEVFSFKALEKSWQEAKTKAYREHVTLYMAENASFSKMNVKNSMDLSSERWTLDRPEDFDLIEYIFKQLYPNNPTFGLEDVLALKEKKPGVFEINQHIVRNEGYKKS